MQRRRRGRKRKWRQRHHQPRGNHGDRRRGERWHLRRERRYVGIWRQCWNRWGRGGREWRDRRERQRRWRRRKRRDDGNRRRRGPDGRRGRCLGNRRGERGRGWHHRGRPGAVDRSVRRGLAVFQRQRDRGRSSRLRRYRLARAERPARLGDRGPDSPKPRATHAAGAATCPSGIAWYRKHFTLPQSLSGQRVFVEFDGVMENSDVYINGTHLGHHPYGWVSFRYDITASVSSGRPTTSSRSRPTPPPSRPSATTRAPASTGTSASIATNPGARRSVGHLRHHAQPHDHRGDGSRDDHGGQLRAPPPEREPCRGSSATPAERALAPVTTAAQSVAAGASAGFTFDVPVRIPSCGISTTPNMYQLLTNVQVGRGHRRRRRHRLRDSRA